MRVLFWACLALLVPGMLLRIDIGGSGILATDLLLPVFAVGWLLYRGFHVRNFPPCRFVGPGFIFLAVAFISLLLGGYELIPKEWALSFAHWVRFAASLVLGWAAVDLFATRTQQDQFFKGLFVITALVVGLGFLQFWLVPDFGTYSTEGGWDPHVGRLFGTWFDPNFMAGFLGFLLPVVVGRWYRDGASPKEKIFLGILGTGMILALFLTFSRSGYLASVFGLGVFFLFRDPKVLLLGVVAAGLGLMTNERAQKRVGELVGTVSAIVLQSTDEIDPTANLRLQSWARTLELSSKYPMLGIGFNTYRYRAAEEGIVQENYFSAGGADSSLLTILVTTGGLGLVAYLFFYLGILWRSFRGFLRTKSPVLLGFSGGLCAIFIHSFFVNSLLFPFIFLPLVALAGVLEHPDA